MSKNRYAVRTDENQKDIVRDLRKAGYSVELDHDDILVGFFGFTFWYEIKREETRSKKTGKILESKIRDDQKRIRSTFKGHYQVVSSSAEIFNDIASRLKKLGICKE